MKKIGIDGRLIDETGVGRYIRNLVSQLGLIDKENHYVVFLRQKSFASFQLPNTRWSKRLADIPWHSFQEQLVLPWLLLSERLDLVHIPYFNVPISYPGKFIVTIHDLTILHFDTGKATTLPLPLYKLRRLGYYLALMLGLKRADKVIAVSEVTKQEIVDHFHIDPSKIVVTHEAVDDKLKAQAADRRAQRRLVNETYFLYVGNAYPHKNLERLLKAFQQFTIDNSHLTIKLILVGEDDFFYRRLRSEASRLKLNQRVVFFGPADDRRLQNLYRHALALVFPSLMEGFGLPGLEAMASGVAVVCSGIPVFREIYADACLTFDPENTRDLAFKLKQVFADSKLRETLISRGRKRIKNFSWEKLAKETLKTYTTT